MEGVTVREKYFSRFCCEFEFHTLVYVFSQVGMVTAEGLNQ